uniref:Tail protein n=1 Tax=Myoviridae sp. ctiv53 TaxID=2827703 RepID=A0A8S5THR3_9CAUD|nr:MAG TPA: tail protein [Myoviridae sp. ctiv53]
MSGFKPEIDSQQWLIKEISHRLDSSGYSCNIQLEGQINLDEPTNDGEKPTPSKKAT